MTFYFASAWSVVEFKFFVSSALEVWVATGGGGSSRQPRSLCPRQYFHTVPFSFSHRARVCWAKRNWVAARPIEVTRWSTWIFSTLTGMTVPIFVLYVLPISPSSGRIISEVEKYSEVAVIIRYLKLTFIFHRLNNNSLQGWMDGISTQSHTSIILRLQIHGIGPGPSSISCFRLPPVNTCLLLLVLLLLVGCVFQSFLFAANCLAWANPHHHEYTHTDIHTTHYTHPHSHMIITYILGYVHRCHHRYYHHNQKARPEKKEVASGPAAPFSPHAQSLDLPACSCNRNLTRQPLSTLQLSLFCVLRCVTGRHKWEPRPRTDRCASRDLTLYPVI